MSPSSWILALESSTAHGSLALFYGSDLQVESTFHSPRQQEIDLFPTLADILTHLPPKQTLDHLLIGRGPGSYNGLRVALSAGQALALAHHAATWAIPSVLGLPPNPQPSQAEALVGDARRGDHFLLPFDRQHPSQPLAPPLLAPPPDLLAHLQRFEGTLWSTQNPSTLFPEWDEPTRARLQVATPHARHLGAFWSQWQGPTDAFQTLEPLYLRPAHITKSTRTIWQPPS